MSFYADNLDRYFLKSNASKSFVRSNKQGYFDRFTKASVTIDNVEVDIHENSAVSTFDKSWIYDGGSQGSGKVRDQLLFRKISGRWLIVSERDIKVYFVNK